MKLLHCSDLHIGKRVNEFSMLADQRYILNKIHDLAVTEGVVGVLLAGDLYDLSTEELLTRHDAKSRARESLAVQLAKRKETEVKWTWIRANVRLMNMTSGRYELCRRKEAANLKSQSGLELNVMDHYRDQPGCPVRGRGVWFPGRWIPGAGRPDADGPHRGQQVGGYHLPRFGPESPAGTLNCGCKDPGKKQHRPG